jgi:ElaA protein
MSPPDEPTWSDLAADDLDVPTLYDVLALRTAVFVVEQECAYQDPDGRDLLPGTRHVVGRVGGELAAYARILPPDSDHQVPRIGRVIVAAGSRGGQLGRALMVRALRTCEEHWPARAVELGAQAHLRGFYESLGFVAVGAAYVEDGIPHQWMRREAAEGQPPSSPPSPPLLPPVC